MGIRKKLTLNYEFNFEFFIFAQTFAQRRKRSPKTKNLI